MHENEQLEIAKRAIEVVLNQFAGPWDKIGLIAFDEDCEVVFRYAVPHSPTQLAPVSSTPEPPSPRT
jgi:hypothetical protein